MSREVLCVGKSVKLKIDLSNYAVTNVAGLNMKTNGYVVNGINGTACMCYLLVNVAENIEILYNNYEVRERLLLLIKAVSCLSI